MEPARGSGIFPRKPDVVLVTSNSRPLALVRTSTPPLSSPVRAAPQPPDHLTPIAWVSQGTELPTPLAQWFARPEGRPVLCHRGLMPDTCAFSAILRPCGGDGQTVAGRHSMAGAHGGSWSDGDDAGVQASFARLLER